MAEGGGLTRVADQRYPQPHRISEGAECMCFDSDGGEAKGCAWCLNALDAEGSRYRIPALFGNLDPLCQVGI